MNLALLPVVYALCALIFGVSLSRPQRFEPFQDPIWGEFGLVDVESAAHSACLRLKFQARLYNYNLNGTPIADEIIADFTSQQVRLRGFCALPNEVKRSAQLQASWKTGERQRLITMKFGERTLRDEVRRHQQQQVRWTLDEVIYREKYKGAWQLFRPICYILFPLPTLWDRLNITLKNPHYERIVMELLPEIDVQPMGTDSRFGSNVYLCERTQRRTLAESFQSRMTIFSGVVLGISSVSLLVGYSLRRQLHIQPELVPISMAESSVGVQHQQPQFYGSF